jgi:hypothetical protein
LYIWQLVLVFYTIPSQSEEIGWKLSHEKHCHTNQQRDAGDVSTNQRKDVGDSHCRAIADQSEKRQLEMLSLDTFQRTDIHLGTFTTDQIL